MMKKVEEVKVLLSGKHPKGVLLEAVFGAGVESLLEKKSPKRREKRRARRLSRKVVRDAASQETKPEVQARRTRHIPQQVRDRVWIRDEGRCTFVGADGVRCSAQHDVEVHHVQAFRKGGQHDEDNLRLLCRKHNMHEAVAEYGGRMAVAVQGASTSS